MVLKPLSQLLYSVLAKGFENEINSELIEKIKAGEHYDFVEMMACPGGCIHGGGQPVVDAYTRATVDVKAERAKALYTEDEKATLRKSHENPVIQKLYADFLGEPCGHKSHELLHTHYTDRSAEK